MPRGISTCTKNRHCIPSCLSNSPQTRTSWAAAKAHFQFSCHHLHFYLYCSITQTLAGANNFPNSDKLVQTWGKSIAFDPSSFNSLRYLLQLKLHSEVTQKGACHNPFLPKKGRTVCYDVGRRDISCCNYFLCIVQGWSEILVEILEIDYEVIWNDAYPTKMWVHSSLPFWGKKVFFGKLHWKTQRASQDWFEW